MLRALLVLLLLWFGNTDASLFTSSNPSIVSSLVTLYSNTSSIDTSSGGNIQTYDHNIVTTNSTQPDASGLGGILYDRQLSCQQNTSNAVPDLLMSGQPKIALVKQGGCSLTDKAWYSQRDNAVAVIVYANVPFDNVPTLTVGDSIKIPLYYVDLELGQTLLRLLQQPSPVTQAATNVTSQAAVKVVLYPFIGGFPTAWEFILIIVVALLALSFLVSMGMHWHLWRIRRRQRTVYETGLAMGTISGAGGHPEKKVLDPSLLALFPTRIVGTDAEQLETAPKLNRRNSTLSLRTERALENAEALAATIIHSKRVSTPPPEDQPNETTAATAIDMDPSRQQEDEQEACVICLDEFGLGESVRKLPCGHEYHCECIDPWLTIKSASCPLCKYDCSMDIPKQDQEQQQQQQQQQEVGATDAASSGGSSIFSLSFIRRHMDEDSTVPRSTTPLSTHSHVSSFGPTIPADQAEAFSRSWMARSLPRNMRRQIDLAAQAQRQQVMTLPARMTVPQEQQQQQQPDQHTRRFFSSLPFRRTTG